MKAYKLRIVLRRVMPEVFRVVLVPAGITFMRLHDVFLNGQSGGLMKQL